MSILNSYKPQRSGKAGKRKAKPGSIPGQLKSDARPARPEARTGHVVSWPMPKDNYHRKISKKGLPAKSASDYIPHTISVPAAWEQQTGNTVPRSIWSLCWHGQRPGKGPRFRVTLEALRYARQHNHQQVIIHKDMPFAHKLADAVRWIVVK